MLTSLCNFYQEISLDIFQMVEFDGVHFVILGTRSSSASIYHSSYFSYMNIYMNIYIVILCYVYDWVHKIKMYFCIS